MTRLRLKAPSPARALPKYSPVTKRRSAVKFLLKSTLTPGLESTAIPLPRSPLQASPYSKRSVVEAPQEVSWMR